MYYREIKNVITAMNQIWILIHSNNYSMIDKKNAIKYLFAKDNNNSNKIMQDQREKSKENLGIEND